MVSEEQCQCQMLELWRNAPQENGAGKGKMLCVQATVDGLAAVWPDIALRTLSGLVTRRAGGREHSCFHSISGTTSVQSHVGRARAPLLKFWRSQPLTQPAFGELEGCPLVKVGGFGGAGPPKEKRHSAAFFARDDFFFKLSPANGVLVETVRCTHVTRAQYLGGRGSRTLDSDPPSGSTGVIAEGGGPSASAASRRLKRAAGENFRHFRAQKSIF